MSCSHEHRASTAPCWQESRVWFILPLPVYNPSKSMNQHRGSGGVRESAGAELLPTPISSAEQAFQGSVLGFPLLNPSDLVRRQAEGPVNMLLRSASAQAVAWPSESPCSPVGHSH